MSSETAIQRSVIYQEIQNQEEAINVLLELLAKEKPDINLLDRLVNLYIELKNNSQASIYNKDIITNFPDDPRGYINKAQ